MSFFFWPTFIPSLFSHSISEKSCRTIAYSFPRHLAGEEDYGKRWGPQWRYPLLKGKVGPFFELNMPLEVFSKTFRTLWRNISELCGNFFFSFKLTFLGGIGPIWPPPTTTSPCFKKRVVDFQKSGVSEVWICTSFL